jgi:hypothetical protein
MSSLEEKRDVPPNEPGIAENEIVDRVDPDPPPDGGYGWVCCAAMLMLVSLAFLEDVQDTHIKSSRIRRMMHLRSDVDSPLLCLILAPNILTTFQNAGVWGILSSYGVYLSYYISHTSFPGTSDIAFTFIGGINFAASMLVAPFVSHSFSGHH